MKEKMKRDFRKKGEKVRREKDWFELFSEEMKEEKEGDD